MRLHPYTVDLVVGDRHRMLLREAARERLLDDADRGTPAPHPPASVVGCLVAHAAGIPAALGTLFRRAVHGVLRPA